MSVMSWKVARALTVASLLAVFVVSVSAQSGRPTWTVPRTPWGDPDLQGIWPGTAMMGVPLERPRQLGEHDTLSDEEFAARANRARTQAQADLQEFVAPPTGRTWRGNGPSRALGRAGRAAATDVAHHRSRRRQDSADDP